VERATPITNGEQKCLEQTKRRGRRLSIIGLLQPLISFVYGLVIGVNRKSYIQIMEVEAQEAEKNVNSINPFDISKKLQAF